MTDTAALIAKLEAATEGSRELDGMIYMHEYPARTGHQYGYMTAAQAVRCLYAVPNYTTSLDAALTRVPEGWFLDLHDWTWAEEPCWDANLQRVHPIHTSVGSKGATAALAVTIAALKARLADTGSK